MTTLSEDGILRLAREAGMPVTDYGSGPFIDDGVTTTHIEKLYTLCRADLVAYIRELEDANTPEINKLRAENATLKAALLTLRETAWVVLSNEEHARSAGIHVYQDGSQTWQVYEDLRVSASDMKRGEA